MESLETVAAEPFMLAASTPGAVTTILATSATNVAKWQRWCLVGGLMTLAVKTSHSPRGFVRMSIDSLHFLISLKKQ
jgi:uncharacterized membrane protein affecting hemolysin expression